jgi:hypothetical protein
VVLVEVGHLSGEEIQDLLVGQEIFQLLLHHKETMAELDILIQVEAVMMQAALAVAALALLDQVVAQEQAPLAVQVLLQQYLVQLHFMLAVEADQLT